MIDFLKKNKQLLWFLLFIPMSVSYFSIQFLGLEHHLIHSPLDDRIPFLPLFILPYVIWYAYLPLLMLAVCFTDKVAFPRQMITFFSGAFLGCIFFCVYPTAIDFRAVEEVAKGEGLLYTLCRWVYAADRPVNVFPSLHCYKAVAVHMTTFPLGPRKLRRQYGWRALSAVFALLACLSTFFVKQHSVLDAFAGVALGILIPLLFHFIYKRKDAHDHKTL